MKKIKTWLVALELIVFVAIVLVIILYDRDIIQDPTVVQTIIMGLIMLFTAILTMIQMQSNKIDTESLIHEKMFISTIEKATNKYINELNKLTEIQIENVKEQIGKIIELLKRMHSATIVLSTVELKKKLVDVEEEIQRKKKELLAEIEERTKHESWGFFTSKAGRLRKIEIQDILIAQIKKELATLDSQRKEIIHELNRGIEAL
jgi:hypothetical protein